MKYDVEFINPMGNGGIHYAVIADSPEDAADQSPHLLAASSQWRPDQFTVVSVKVSIYEESQ